MMGADYGANSSRPGVYQVTDGRDNSKCVLLRGYIDESIATQQKSHAAIYVHTCVWNTEIDTRQ